MNTPVMRKDPSLSWGLCPQSPGIYRFGARMSGSTMHALERRIGQRRDATRAPSPAPEWRGRLRPPQNHNPKDTPNTNLFPAKIGLDIGVHFPPTGQSSRLPSEKPQSLKRTDSARSSVQNCTDRRLARLVGSLTQPTNVGPFRWVGAQAIRSESQSSREQNIGFSSRAARKLNLKKSYQMFRAGKSRHSGGF